MFVVSLHEQSIIFNLHKKTGDKFENYEYTKNCYNEITSIKSAIPLHKIIIYGYIAQYVKNKNISNVYFEDKFAITEIEDKLFEHLMAEHGNSNALFKNNIIFNEKKQLDAILCAREKTHSNAIRLINTGSRPYNINPSENLFGLR